MRLSGFIALAAFGAAIALTPSAQGKPGHSPAGHWQLLAFKTVGAGTDRDTIRVRQGQRYRFVQLCSFNAPIHLVDFTVRFENGRRQDVNVRSRIAARSCTRAIRLDGANARRIDRIDLTYERVQRSVHVPLIRVMAR